MFDCVEDHITTELCELILFNSKSVYMMGFSALRFKFECISEVFVLFLVCYIL